MKFSCLSIRPLTLPARLMRQASLALLLFSVVSALTSVTRADTIVSSKHNLSSTGPGTVKANSETDLCLFCHTIHQTTGQTPLWSHALSAVTNYTVYSSPTLKASVGQPDGSSRLCLSCHDGTVALGMVSSRTTTIEMRGGVKMMPSGPANLGTDLSDDHPISFVYDQNLLALDNQIKNPSTLDPKLKLDPLHKVQCVTCHDPHDNKNGSFLVMDNTASALCLGCHLQNGWQGSAHNTASIGSTTPPINKVNATGPPSPHTATATGCQTCHTSHKAGSKARLLIHAKEEQNCFVCHNGKGLVKDLAPEFNKPSAHPVIQTSGMHSLVEDPLNAPRHSACADCHNSHAAPANQGNSTAKSQALIGVKGLNAAGVSVSTSSAEYEICFKCHAESKQKAPARVPRQFSETDKRVQFQRSNQSAHPIESTGHNPNVPSLISPLTSASTITCTDCHNNDRGIKAGGSGPNGPHGSSFVPILERQLVLTDNNPENAANYALCYKCHSRASILADQSFRATGTSGQDRGHRFHIVDQRTACTTCHDSHGVVRQAGLINFNSNYARSSANGRLEFVKTGTYSGNCSVSCHGKDHNATAYPNSLVQRNIKRPAIVPGTIKIGN